MSLDDKFFPEDGTLLTKVDNTLIKSAGKVGEAYQHVTGDSYKNLVSYLYTATAAAQTAAALLCIPQAPWLTLIFGMNAYNTHKESKKPHFKTLIRNLFTSNIMPSWRHKKVYGQSRVEQCPFCSKNSYSRNAQGVPVCDDHKDRDLPAMKCACGSYLDMKESKYGTFFVCMSCGPVSMKKALEINNLDS